MYVVQRSGIFVQYKLYIKTVSVFHGFKSPSPSLFVHLVRNPNMWFLQKEATTCSLLGGFIPSPGPIGSTSTSRRWSVSPGRSVKRSTGCALHSAERTLAETWEKCSNNEQRTSHDSFHLIAWICLLFWAPHKITK